MRRFELIRTEDVSGMSGIGVVAEGVVFTDGAVALRWRGSVKSLVVYNSIADCEHIHGHGGRTTVRWLDPQ